MISRFIFFFKTIDGPRLESFSSCSHSHPQENYSENYLSLHIWMDVPQSAAHAESVDTRIQPVTHLSARWILLCWSCLFFLNASLLLWCHPVQDFYSQLRLFFFLLNDPKIVSNRHAGLIWLVPDDKIINETTRQRENQSKPLMGVISSSKIGSH